eukprot:4456840-Amphidinium_carterae.1
MAHSRQQPCPSLEFSVQPLGQTELSTCVGSMRSEGETSPMSSPPDIQRVLRTTMHGHTKVQRK